MNPELHVTSRKEWRLWLSKNHATEKEIWLVYYKKHTGKPRVAYDDAVEEALCFSWIDSIVRTIDDERYLRTQLLSQSVCSRNVESATQMLSVWSFLTVGIIQVLMLFSRKDHTG